MKSGFSKICINPPLGAPISGYYEARFTKGIHDDIFVRTVAFCDGETTALVIALDLCEFPQCYFDYMKDAITAACDVHRDAIFITCSHTHTGPIVGKDFASNRASTKEYDAFLVNSVNDFV